MNDSLEKAINTIVKVAEPDKIILFGSHARGDDKHLSFKDVGAPIDVIVADLDKYEHLKTDPYMIYYEADKNGRMVYEKS